MYLKRQYDWQGLDDLIVYDQARGGRLREFLFHFLSQHKPEISCSKVPNDVDAGTPSWKCGMRSQ